MLDVDFANGQYRYELQRRQELLGSVGLPVAVLTALGGLIVLVAREFSYRGPMAVPFCVFLAVSVVLFAVAALSLARAYLESTYGFIPTLGTIAAFKTDLEMFYVGLGYPAERADTDFGEQLTRWYVEVTDTNTATNDRVARQLMHAAQAITGLLIALAVCGILYVADVLRWI
jgi:hypothetical protein